MKIRRADSGFSLMEALVAMTVLSVSAGTLLAAVENHTRTIVSLSDRATARWVAENRLVELGLGLEGLGEQTRADGRDWRIKTTTSDTTDPDLVRVDITVGPMDDVSVTFAQLTGFLDVSEVAS